MMDATVVDALSCGMHICVSVSGSWSTVPRSALYLQPDQNYWVGCM
jgi:hypothetical protein